MKISVLMPVYNCAKYLDVAIKSILSQTFREFEFIIVDDASIDSSRTIIKKYSKKDPRIVFIPLEKHVGTSKALNKGLSSAVGKYIVRMDADDWSYPDRLEKQYRFMESHKEVGVSGGAAEICDEKLNRRYTRRYPVGDSDLRKIIFLYSPFAHPATIWNKKLLEELNGYDENIPLSQDAELYFRIGAKSKFANIKDVLIKLRMHDKSSSIAKNRLQEKYAIYARIKGVMEYRYKARIIDWLYIFFRLMSAFFIPTQIKFFMFNLLRRKK
ncbi:MAG: glycosyltransferase [Candidatus Woesebacteria bacterium]|nr:MAG: glycosyltransferase [Candidatus Woesebacteria bacterium]